MKQKFYISFYFTYLLFLNSCSNNKIVFPETIEIKAELIYINEIIYPEFLTMKGNHLVIASSRTEPMIYTYSLPSLSFLKASVNKGRGPGEIPFFPMFCESPGSEMLYVSGYTPTSIGKNEIGIDGALILKEEFQLSGFESRNNMSVVNDSIFIYFDIDNLTIKKYNLYTQNLLDFISFELDNHGESYYYSNRGYVANNERFIIYPYIFKKQIDIFDLGSFKLNKSLKWKADAQILTIGDASSLTHHYRYIYAGENYFYALYGGNEGKEPIDTRLEVYDYGGNPIREYILNIRPIIFVVDEKNSVLYGLDYRDTEHFIKYDL